MINLLYIIEGGQHAGGAEQNLLTLIKVMDKTQYKIKICLLKQSDILEDAFKKLDIQFFVLNTAGRWDIFSCVKLAWFMLREKIKIAHSCLYVSNTVGRMAAILTGVPIIIAWEQGQILGQPSARHYKIDGILAKFSDCIVACSKACKEAIIKKEGIPSGKIRVIYNCVDLDKFNALSDSSASRKRLGIGPDEILIGNISSLNNKIKGQEHIIRAMPQIVRAYPKTKLILVGEGRSKSDFVDIIKSLNIEDKVIFTGFRSDISEIANALDLYVCSSNWEGLGISMLEVMSFKKPVIATRVGGIPEVVTEGRTGFLVPPKDADSIAQAVISLLADRERMRQMGEAGYERVKSNFSSEIIIKEIEGLYKELSCKILPEYQ